MSAPMSTRMMRQLTRTISTKPLSRSLHQRATSKLQAPKPRVLASTQSQARCFSVSRSASKGIQPHSEDPQPKESEAIDDIKNPTPLSDAEYHDRAESLLEEIVAKMESMQEQRDDVDVEYSAGVLTLTHPPNGTYVLNKQPANKQIWLSSPITGPKRFDWVLKGESMEAKEGTASGDWVYIRDGSSLISILRKELGITVGNEEGSME